MQVYSDFSGMVRARGEAVRDVSKHPLVAPSDKLKLQQEMNILERRRQVLSSLGVSGLKVFVGGGSVAGWYAPGSGEMGISEALLDRPSDARHVIEHERMHARTRISEIDFSFLTSDEAEVLGVDTKASPLLVMEGFNEWATEEITGKRDWSGYTKWVHMVRNLGVRVGSNLVDFYKSGNVEGMFSVMREAASRILFHKASKMEGIVIQFSEMKQAPKTLDETRMLLREMAGQEKDDSRTNDIKDAA